MSQSKTKKKFELPIWTYFPLSILTIGLGIYIALGIQALLTK